MFALTAVCKEVRAFDARNGFIGITFESGKTSINNELVNSQIDVFQTVVAGDVVILRDMMGLVEIYRARGNRRLYSSVEQRLVVGLVCERYVIDNYPRIVLSTNTGSNRCMAIFDTDLGSLIDWGGYCGQIVTDLNVAVKPKIKKNP